MKYIPDHLECQKNWIISRTSCMAVLLRLHTPTLADAPPDRAKEEPFNEKTDRDDDEHDAKHLAHVGQFPTHVQEKAEPRKRLHHLGGDDAVPAESPAQLESGDDRGKRRGQDDSSHHP